MKLFKVNGFPREAGVFIFASFVNALGSAFMWPLTTLYVYTFFERPLADAGFVLLLYSLAGIIGQLLGGMLYHRLGVKKLIVGALALAAAMQFSLMLTDRFAVYAVIMTALGLFSSASMPAIQAFIAFRWPASSREMFNATYVGNNIGVAIGTALGGLVANYSFQLTFMLNGTTSVLFAAFFYFFLRTMKTDRLPDKSAQGLRPGRAAQALRLLIPYKLYLFVGLGSLFVWFANSMWGTGVAPFLYDEGMDLSAYSLLWTINGVLIFVGQPVIMLIKKCAARSLTSQMTASAVFYFLGFMIILANHSYVFIVLGMIVTTFGEMLIGSTVPAFITENAGGDSPFYLGITGGIGSVGRVLGPYVLGVMYDWGGMTQVSYVAVIGAAVAVALFMLHASLHRAKRSEASVTLDR